MSYPNRAMDLVSSCTTQQHQQQLLYKRLTWTHTHFSHFQRAVYALVQ
jgi:hypothetical protein